MSVRFNTCAEATIAQRTTPFQLTGASSPLLVRTASFHTPECGRWVSYRGKRVRLDLCVPIWSPSCLSRKADHRPAPARLNDMCTPCYACALSMKCGSAGREVLSTNTTVACFDRLASLHDLVRMKATLDRSFDILRPHMAGWHAVDTTTTTFDCSPPPASSQVQPHLHLHSTMSYKVQVLTKCF